MKLPKTIRFYTWKHFISEMKHRFRGWDLKEMITAISLFAAFLILIIVCILYTYKIFRSVLE